MSASIIVREKKTLYKC